MSEEEKFGEGDQLFRRNSLLKLKEKNRYRRLEK